MMTVEFENNLYKVYWHDVEQSILIVEIWGRWTWHDAQEIVARGNDILATVNHKKYLICHIFDDASKLPIDNKFAMSTIRRLILNDPSEEEFFIFVGSMKLLKRLIKMTGEIYSLLGITQKYRYTEDVSSALAEIYKHKLCNQAS